MQALGYLALRKAGADPTPAAAQTSPPLSATVAEAITAQLATAAAAQPAAGGLRPDAAQKHSSGQLPGPPPLPGSLPLQAQSEQLVTDGTAPVPADDGPMIAWELAPSSWRPNLSIRSSAPEGAALQTPQQQVPCTQTDRQTTRWGKEPPSPARQRGSWSGHLVTEPAEEDPESSVRPAQHRVQDGSIAAPALTRPVEQLQGEPAVATPAVPAKVKLEPPPSEGTGRKRPRSGSCSSLDRQSGQTSRNSGADRHARGKDRDQGRDQRARSGSRSDPSNPRRSQARWGPSMLSQPGPSGLAHEEQATALPDAPVSTVPSAGTARKKLVSQNDLVTKGSVATAVVGQAQQDGQRRPSPIASAAREDSDDSAPPPPPPPQESPPRTEDSREQPPLPPGAVAAAGTDQLDQSAAVRDFLMGISGDRHTHLEHTGPAQYWETGLQGQPVDAYDIRYPLRPDLLAGWTRYPLRPDQANRRRRWDAVAPADRETHGGQAKRHRGEHLSNGDDGTPTADEGLPGQRPSYDPFSRHSPSPPPRPANSGPRLPSESPPPLPESSASMLSPDYRLPPPSGNSAAWRAVQDQQSLPRYDPYGSPRAASEWYEQPQNSPGIAYGGDSPRPVASPPYVWPSYRPGSPSRSPRGSDPSPQQAIDASSLTPPASPLHSPSPAKWPQHGDYARPPAQPDSPSCSLGSPASVQQDGERTPPPLPPPPELRHMPPLGFVKHTPL